MSESPRLFGTRIAQSLVQRFGEFLATRWKCSEGGQGPLVRTGEGGARSVERAGAVEQKRA